MLRAAVGLAAVVAGFFYFSGPASISAGRWVLGLLLVGSGAALEVGFLTPLMGSLAGVCFLGIALSWFPAPQIETSTEKILALGIVVAAASLALLGPGAFSLDGRLFGRREIVIPASRPHEK